MARIYSVSSAQLADILGCTRNRLVKLREQYDLETRLIDGTRYYHWAQVEVLRKNPRERGYPGQMQKPQIEEMLKKVL